MWFTYLLLCRDKSIYTGVTNDLALRLKHHREGMGAAYTRSHKPVKILYSETFRTRSSALKREIEIKKLRRKEKLELAKAHRKFS